MHLVASIRISLLKYGSSPWQTIFIFSEIKCVCVEREREREACLFASIWISLFKHVSSPWQTISILSKRKCVCAHTHTHMQSFAKRFPHYKDPTRYISK